jgi:site-specific DNA-cytosine methylase
MNHDDAGGMRLVYWTLDLIAACRPDSWSLEQVPAAMKHLQRENVPCKIVDAADYGAAQHRRRCFAGQGWTLPPPLHGVQLSVAAVLPHVAKIATHVRGNSNSRALYHQNGTHLGNRRLQGWEGFRSIHEPCFTLLGHGRRLQLFAADGRGRPVLVRDLTSQEYLVLQGFPKAYAFPSRISSRERYKLIGNSLVPRIAYLIVQSAMRLDHKTMAMTMRKQGTNRPHRTMPARRRRRSRFALR